MLNLLVLDDDLADGDALIAKASFLGTLCDELRAAFPKLRRISCYASPQALQVRSVDEMRALRGRGLTQYYVGIESGDDQTLSELIKGVNADEWAECCAKATEAGVKLSAMILLGAAGPDRERARAHALASAALINRIQPRFLSTLVMCPRPGTPLWANWRAGRWVESTPDQLREEMATFLDALELDGTIFRSNHVSNQDVLAGNFPRDKQALVAALRD